MSYGKYLVSVDENGQPYIAHAYGPSRHSQSSHRYKYKIRTGNGPKDYRYFYSEEEYQKYLENEKRKYQSYKAREQKKYDAIKERAKLKKEYDRYMDAEQKARRRGLNTLAERMYKKAVDLNKRMDALYEIGFGKGSGGDFSDINIHLLRDGRI